MRCLYCGKELALLKRWTGGGEFCSDAHRQQYQEEYNQLALNRLLQAKPPSEAPAEAPAKPAAAGKPSAEPEKEVPVQSPQRQAAPPPKPAYREPAPASARVETPRPAARVVLEEPPPVVHQESAPAEAAGFLVELPEPALAEVSPMSLPDMEFVQLVGAALPDHAFEPLNGNRGNFQLETAGLLVFQPSNRVSNYTANGSRERRLEVRDFVRTTPVVEIDLTPAGETGWETSREAMDLLISPQSPQGPAPLWLEPAAEFTSGATELGDLARLSFASTGFSDAEDASPQVSNEVTEPASTVQEPRPNLGEIAPAEVDVEIHVEPEPESPVLSVNAVVPEPVSAIEVEAEPEISPETLKEAIPVAVEAVPEPAVSQVPVVTEEIEAVVEASVEPVAEPVAERVDAVPDPVTKPLPLVLQVAGPGKAKTVQVFASASSSVAVQAPRATSSPLRSVMILGPAPAPAPAAKEAEKTPERPARNEPRKSIPTVPVRTGNGKPRQPELKAEVKAQDAKADAKPEMKPTQKTPSPEPAKAEPAVARQAPKFDLKLDNKKPEVKELKVKEEAKPPKQVEPFQPAPLAAPYPETGDLGLPRLNLQSSPGFWGGLPMMAKIAIGVVLVAGIGGLIAFTSKGSGAAVTAPSSAGTVVVGAPLPVGDSGWITDWGADPGVRRTRQISILRSSQTLTDYRIEMQGQIETKAIGWVFRAADPKNFYVTKLEIVKPGLQPTVALVRFAVINGEEQAHAQLPLPMKVRRDTMYKIRFDAVGNSFTTYVQDEKIDQWNDDHVRTGGVGLYSERGEVATLRGGMSVLPLVVRR